MNHNVTLLEGDDYGLNDDLPDELDFSTLKSDVERTRRFRAQAVARQLLDALDADVL